MSFHENIDSIKNQVIPEELDLTYLKLFNIMLTIQEEYKEIESKDYDSLEKVKEKENVKLLLEEQINQLKSLRKKEELLIKREKELEFKLLNGEILSKKEEDAFHLIYEKKSILAKNISSVIKRISRLNYNFMTLDSERYKNENKIEQDRNLIKNRIDDLIKLIETIEKSNFGLERLDRLEVKENHLNNNNKIILEQNKNVSNEVLDSFNRIFKNSLEIRINMFREIYNEALLLIEAYRKHENINFDNINILINLFDIKLCDKPYSIFPYSNINDDLRHINEYSLIIEEINNITKGELSKEEVKLLGQRVYNELNNTDMSHNFLHDSVYAILPYLDKVYKKRNGKGLKNIDKLKK